MPLFAVILLMSIAPIGYAQSDAETAGPANGSESIDEVVVVGEAQLDDLRLKLYTAEVEVYDLFNDLNDDNEFDVSCEQKAPVGSHIKQRYCQPRFVARLYNEALRERGSNRISPSQYNRKQEEFQAIMETLANENDDLLKALVDYGQAADRYDAALEAR